MLEVCEELARAKIKQKYIQTSAEQKDLKPVEIVYLDISSQKDPIYGGSKNWILLKYFDTNKNGFYSQRYNNN